MGAVALAGFALAMVGFAGCADSTLDAGTTAVMEKYSAYSVNAQTLSTGTIASLDRILAVGGEIPTYDSTLSPDSTTTGSNDDDDDGGFSGSGRHHGGRACADGSSVPGLGELIPVSYTAAIDSLGLTAEQDTLVTLCFEQARACGLDARMNFLAVRRAIDVAMRPSLDSIRALVQAGTMTRDEAVTAIDAIRATYATQVSEMNAAYVSSVASCRSSLDSCIRGHLTADQLIIWIRLTGTTVE